MQKIDFSSNATRKPRILIQHKHHAPIPSLSGIFVLLTYRVTHLYHAGVRPARSKQFVTLEIN